MNATAGDIAGGKLRDIVAHINGGLIKCTDQQRTAIVHAAELLETLHEPLPPTSCDDEWAEWQVGDVVVGTGMGVCLYIEGCDGLVREIPVRDPEALVRALRAAAQGEWGPAEVAL